MTPALAAALARVEAPARPDPDRVSPTRVAAGRPLGVFRSLGARRSFDARRLLGARRARGEEKR